MRLSFDFEWEINFRNPFAHRCAPVPVSVEHDRVMPSAFSIAFGARDPGPRAVTRVLSRCRCGAVSTSTLEGSWTLEQVLDGKRPPDPIDALIESTKGAPK